MMQTTGTAHQDAGALAERLLHGDGVEFDRPCTILTHPEGRSLVERREALRPVYAAVVARIGEPTRMGGTAQGPHVRWGTKERELLLSGDHGEARLSVHEGDSLVKREFWEFDGGGRPYIWQLDREGPGYRHGWDFIGHRAGFDWAEAETMLAGTLASWAEHIPVQAPGDWVGFQIWASRYWQQYTMVVAYTPRDTGREFHVGIADKGDAPEYAAEMRARGWRDRGEYGHWRTELPETDPDAPTKLAQVVIADLRARGTTCPDEVYAWDIGVGDKGVLWTPGLGFEIHPRRRDEFAEDE